MTDEFVEQEFEAKVRSEVRFKKFYHNAHSLSDEDFVKAAREIQNDIWAMEWRIRWLENEIRMRELLK